MPGGFDYVNLHWYWIFQKNWPAIEEATRRDMGVFIISPADKGGKLYEPPEKLVKLCEPWPPLVQDEVFRRVERDVRVRVGLATADREQRLRRGVRRAAPRERGEDEWRPRGSQHAPSIA